MDVHTAEWAPASEDDDDDDLWWKELIDGSAGPLSGQTDAGPLGSHFWLRAADVLPPDSSDEEEDEGPFAAEARALQAARNCSVRYAYALLRRRERKKREKLMEGWRRAKWLRFMLRRARVRYVHVHARHVVRERLREHELHAYIFGISSEDTDSENEL